MVKADGLAKQYGTLVALDDFSLEVGRGEILALVGPNGAGKTTALKLMVGLLTPTRGRVVIGGFDVHRQSLDAKRLLSFIPDQPLLYEQLTVAELLSFLGGVYQVEPALVEQRAQALLRLFDLHGALAQRVGQLSYGMRSRVVLLASLLHAPQALIMDEPFFGLDPQTLRLTKQLLLERARGGMAILLSTHQLSVVEDVAHRIAVLSQGRLVALGSLADLAQQSGRARLEDVFFHLTSPIEPA